MKQTILCLVLIHAALNLNAAPFAITNASVDGDTVLLSWEPEPERAILSRSTSLTGSFEYVGSVLARNTATVTNGLNTAFYRIRRVTLIAFPDPHFEAVVREAIEGQALKYGPTTEVFDIDVEPVTYIPAWYEGISDMSGICWLSAVTNLDCSWNNLTDLDLSANKKLRSLDCNGSNLTELNLSANTNLIWLDCSYNRLTTLDLSANSRLTECYCRANNLTNLDLSANANLRRIDCRNNPITEIIVADTNNLPETFQYGGNPIIREP